MSVVTTLFDIATTIEESQIGTAIAESRYAFLIIEGIHLIGLSIAAGLIAITDLRLMGLAFSRVPVLRVLRALRPWVLAGFAVIFVSGGLLFWSSAARVLNSPAFTAKMLLILAGGLNAAYFEFVLAKRYEKAADPNATPRAFRLAGAASIVLWSLVIVGGRLIPYLPSWTGAPDALH
jgi:hypothetical protein